jgi:hypothetical protein
MTTVSDEMYLYGMDGWEHLYTDLQSAIESHFDNFMDPEEFLHGTYVFYEYDCEPMSCHMPDVDHHLEWIHDQICENGTVDEWFCEHAERACNSDEAKAAMQNVFDVIASKIHYRMAGKILRTINVKVTGITEHGIVEWTETDG